MSYIHTYTTILFCFKKMKSCHKAPTWTNLEGVMLCKKPGKTRKEAVFLLTAMPSKRLLQSIQVFGCKKTATANGALPTETAHQGKRTSPGDDGAAQAAEQVPGAVLLLGKEQFAGVDIWVHVKDSSHGAQIYAI